MTDTGTPPQDVVIDEALVRRLLRSQHPDLADLPLAELPSGWDHVMMALGDDLAVRLPRRRLGASMIAGEQRMLSAFGTDLPVPVPVPVRVGVPGPGYPYRWSVVPRFEGVDASRTTDVDLAAAARDLGTFLASLHRPAPADAPRNPYRGVPLDTYVDEVEGRLDQLRGDAAAALGVDVGRLAAVFADAVGRPPWPGPRTWVHGDLHPRNLLVRNRRIVAVLDFSDVCQGDPAVDAAVAWLLLPPEVHAVFRERSGTLQDDDTWRRGRGWGLRFGLILYLAGRADDDPGFERLGRAALERLAAS